MFLTYIKYVDESSYKDCTYKSLKKRGTYVQGVSSVYCNVGTKENSFDWWSQLVSFWERKPNEQLLFIYDDHVVMYYTKVTCWNDKILALWIHGASRLNKSIKLRNLHCLVDAKTKGYVYTHWMFQGRGPCYRQPFRSLLATAHADDVCRLHGQGNLRQHVKGQTESLKHDCSWKMRASRSIHLVTPL